MSIGAEDLMVLAVDPGTEHTGMAWHSSETGKVDTDTVAPKEALRLVQGVRPDILVIESFVLYPRQADSFYWQELEVSELIGRFLQIAEDHGMDVIKQGANIKNPTAAQVQARGWHLTGGTQHARDAELHLLHRILQWGFRPENYGGEKP